MNRQNIWIHITIAVIVITLAAVLGQIRRWQSTLGMFNEKTTTTKTTKPTAVNRSTKDCQPEVLVKFRPNIDLTEIKKIAAKNNDKVEDEIEAVKNLISIDDLDGVDAEKVAEQYRRMTDLVLYAEPIVQIRLEPTETYREVTTRAADEPNLPNDPMFTDQWALKNAGQNGGKENADISAIKAWAKTKGSKKVVVAVLDTGVEYLHLVLVTNLWIRPASVPQ